MSRQSPIALWLKDYTMPNKVFFSDVLLLFTLDEFERWRLGDK